MSHLIALVTGCSEGGIGFEFVKQLTDRGYIVYATARKLSSLEGLAHASVRKHVLDVTSDQNVQQVVDAVIAETGRIDLLINNAGVLAPGPMADCTSEEIKAVYDTNVFGILRMCRTVLPHMAKRQSGTIVNIGSIVGEFPTPWMGIYDSSKAAVRILTEVLSLEARPFNVKVTLVAPAAIKSEIINKSDDYRLPANSIYHDFAHNIRERLEAAREPSATATDAFAAEIIGKVTSPNPPAYILTGGKSYMFRVLAYLPRASVLNIVWDMFSKPAPK